MRKQRNKILIITALITASWQTEGSSHLGPGSYGYVSETTHNFLFHSIFSWSGLLFLVIAVALILVLNKKIK